MFLSQIAQTAIEQGKPELLDFTKIKDKDGISLETVFGDAIKQYRLAWELVKNNPKDPNYNKIRKALERFEKALSGSITR